MGTSSRRADIFRVSVAPMASEEESRDKDGGAGEKVDAGAGEKADAGAGEKVDAGAGEKADANRDGGRGKAAPNHRAAVLTAWSNAITAVTKAAVVVVLTFIAVRFLWRDYKHQTLTIAIDDDSKKRLAATGTNIDLGMMLIEEVNTRMRFATAVVTQQALGDVVSTQDHEDFTFKPFGLDASAGDVTKIVRSILDKAPPPLVTITLATVAGDPSATKTSEKLAPDAAVDLDLVVLVKADGTTQRLTFRVPSNGPAARRRLREAMARASEKLLEATSPVLASVVQLNHGFFSPFPDDMQRHHQIATGLTARLRTRAPADACMGDVILGCTEFENSEPGWFDTLRRAADGNVTPTCTIHAQTNIAIFDMEMAYQRTTPAQRDRDLANAAAALKALDKIEKSGSNAIRVQGLGFQLDFLTARSKAGADVAWQTPTILSFLARVKEKIPPDAVIDSTSIDGVFDLPVGVVEAIAPENVEAHLKSAAALVTAIDGYIHRHPWPRDLYLLQGRLYADLTATIQGLISSSEARHNVVQYLNDPAVAGILGDRSGVSGSSDKTLLGWVAWTFNRSAQVAFENAAGAENTLPPLEASIEMEPLLRLGDARIGAGDRRGAREAYARAVEAFIDHDEPTRDVRLLAQVTARWATSLLREGACEDPPRVRDQRWDRDWKRLGVATDNVLCGSRKELLDRRTEGLGVLGVIGPLVSDAIESCGDATASGASGGGVASDLGCVRQHGGDAQSQWNAYTQTQPSTVVDSLITEALVSVPGAALVRHPPVPW